MSANRILRSETQEQARGFREPDYLHPGRFKDSSDGTVTIETTDADFIMKEMEKKRNGPSMNSNLLHTNFPAGVGLQLDDGRKRRIRDFLDSRYFIGVDEDLAKDAKYFSEGSFSLQDDQYTSGGTPPQAFLLDPVSRKGTSRSDFGLTPCGGASKGQSRFMADPGQKTEVEWLIKDPVEGGHCQIMLSRDENDDPSSFEKLHVEGNGYDSSTGKFKCGDPQKTIESATVRLPYDTSCPH